MEAFYSVLAALFLPCLAAGLLVGAIWRRVPAGPLRTRLQIVAALLFFVPQPLILFFLWQSIELVLYQEALLAAWLCMMGVMMAWRGWRRGTERPGGRPRRSPLIIIPAALLFAGFGLYLGWQFAGDVFLPRLVVAGPVEKLQYRRGGRTPRLCLVVIRGRACNATRDTFRKLRIGQNVRAEVGRGSNCILGVSFQNEGPMSAGPRLR